jgi:hypothetical protein
MAMEHREIGDNETSEPGEATEADTRPAGRQPRTLAARHHAAVVAAEVRRLQRALRAVGPMPRCSLAKASHVDRWREGAFEEAVREGIAQGKLRKLPLDWIESAER